MTKIKEIRKSQKLTQLELATLSSLSRNTILNFESGKRSPKLVDLMKIANALNCKVSELVDGGSGINGNINTPSSSRIFKAQC